MKTNKTRKIFFRIGRFFWRGKREGSNNSQFFLELASRKQMKGNPQLRITGINQKQDEKQRAPQENLGSEKLFCDTGQYHKGTVIRNKLLKEGSEMELMKVKLSDTCEKMRLADQTLTQHHKTYYSDKTMNLEGKGEERNSDAKKDNPNRIAETTLLHPPDTEISCFFDLAKILEENSSLELGEVKSITIEESYSLRFFLEDSKENKKFRETISL